MALMFCRECNKKISDTADKCVHCGAPTNQKLKNKKNKNFWGWFFSIWFFISGFIVIFMDFLTALFFFIVAFIIYPNSNKMLNNIFKKDLNFGSKFKLILICFIFFLIISAIISSGPKQNYNADSYINANKDDFLLSNNDLSSEWRFISNNHYRKISGLDYADIVIVVENLNNLIDANNYYNSKINKIIEERGYAELPTKYNNCFITEIKHVLGGQTIQSLCIIGHFYVSVKLIETTPNFAGVSIDSILYKVHNVDK